MHKLIALLVFISTISFGQVQLSIDKIRSKVKWEGSYVIGGGHHGVISFKSGHIVTENDLIKSGEMVIDMTSIKNIDLGNDSGDLEAHLKSADFFDAASFAEGFFTFDSITPNPGIASYNQFNVSGHLTLKGIRKAITVPVTITTEDTAIHVTGTFTIDRTQWDIKYQSLTFWNDLKDGAISDLVKLELDLYWNSGNGQ